MSQVVILCGGRGERLKPITDDLPKPMVDVNGRPFLDYVINSLDGKLINEIILLTGYKKNIIKDYFKKNMHRYPTVKVLDGEDFWSTSRRLWEARNFLNNKFILLYGDNLLRVNLNNFEDYHVSLGVDITMHLRCTKGCGNVDFNQITKKVSKYDKGGHYNYTELGYMYVNKVQIISAIYKFGIDSDYSDILKILIENDRVAGRLTEDFFLTITNKEMLDFAKLKLI